MKSILITAGLLVYSLFVHNTVLAQKGMEDHYETMSSWAISQDKSELYSLMSPYEYTEDYDCYDGSPEGNLISQAEIDKYIAEALRNIQYDFELEKSPHEDALDDIQSHKKYLEKLKPYMPYRFWQFDSILSVSNSLLNQSIDNINNYWKSFNTYVKEHFCDNDIGEVPYSDNGLTNKIETHLRSLEEFTGFDNYYFDLNYTPKWMKKYKLLSIDLLFEPDYYEGVPILMTGEIHNGKRGLYGQLFKKFYQYIPSEYDSIQYHNEVEYAFAWNNGKVKFYFLDNLGMLLDEFPDAEMLTEIMLPYEEIAFYLEGYGYNYFYSAKKDGKWGAVHAVKNEVVVDFTYDSWEDIDWDLLR